MSGLRKTALVALAAASLGGLLAPAAFAGEVAS
ncbi:hypothetical protein MSIMFI_03648 [Mycobacterium simulans]|nr:hypothetical protein MSIMFI_03648 [Mycobacterium simulans]